MANSEYHAIVAEPYNSSLSSPRSIQISPRRKPVPNFVRIDGLTDNSKGDSQREPDTLLHNPSILKIARTLRTGKHHNLLQILVDTSLIALPCLFIALAILAAYLNGHPLSSYGQRVEQASRLGPTIFPIAFAAIVARFNRYLATWQAERGQYLGILEQLMQSQSLAGSVVAAYNLRNVGINGFAILLLWTLSPLGGQSSLRVFTNSEAVITSQTTIYGATAESMNYFGGSSHEVTTMSVINALFSAGLLAPDNVRDGPVDLWGNVKIPAAKYVSALNSDTWYTVDAQSKSMNYSSFVGIPTWGVPEQGTVNYTLTWPIFYTDCTWQLPGYTAMEWCVNISKIYCATSNDVCLDGGIVNGSCVPDGSSSNNIVPFYNGPGIFDSDLWKHLNESDMAAVNATQLQSSSPPRYLDITYSIFNESTVRNVSYVGTKAQCKLRTTRVEAEVFCTDASCRVSRLRKSNDSRPDFINPWNDATVHQEEIENKLEYFAIMLAFIRTTTGSTIYGYATPLDAFLSGISRPFSKFEIGPIHWKNVSAADFSARLSLLINTYWTIAQWPGEISDHSITNLSSLSEVTGRDISDFQKVSATKMDRYSVYKANYVWITILLVVSLILLICTLASLSLRLFTIAPDVLGYVSSLTRDSQYFEPLRPGGSTLSGEQRARRLRDVKVQVADVHPDARVGHVAFVRAEMLQGEKPEYARLRKERHYD